MRELRKHFTMGLLLLMCTLTGHGSESAPSAAPAGRTVQQDLRRMVEFMKHVEGNRGRHGARTAAPLATRARTSPAVGARKTHSVVIIPIDGRKKEKFLNHLTGPLYFSPKCKKDRHNLYHHTRDCTIPAYYKRCAQLLIQLASSRQCIEG